MPPENLESRVTALEGQVRDLRDEVQANKLDVTTTQALIVAVDRDVSAMSDFRQATTSTMNALRADMVDMSQDITGLRETMSAGFAEIRGRFELTAAGQQRIVELIQTVIAAPGDNDSD